LLRSWQLGFRPRRIENYDIVVILEAPERSLESVTTCELEKEIRGSTDLCVSTLRPPLAEY
jgi:hypothetical protein